MLNKTNAPVIKKKVTKTWTNRYVRVFSRHPSHNVIRQKLLFKDLAVVRLGSTTISSISKEVNSIKGVQNSANKYLMKVQFDEHQVKTAPWFAGLSATGPNDMEAQLNTLSENWEYPIVAKHIFGSRGTGNTLLRTKAEYDTWVQGKTLNRYIFERFYNFNREYRLHVTADGCFYTCRKMLKSDTPEDKRWFRNDSNSTWIIESNPQFDKPVNWNSIVEQSINALKAVGLDIGAVDLRIQSAKNGNGELRDNPEFIIVEINSAPSFGEITAQKYSEQIPKILKRKYGN